MEHKQHYVVLDGLRGVAAISVVIFHLFDAIYPNHSINPLPHGFLAVDFFFCLSGFIIGYAYDDRASKIDYLSFIKKRLIRLHPLVIVGSVLGLAIYFLDPWGNYSKAWDFGLVGIPFLQSNFLIPTSIPVLNRYGDLFPFNPPAWSLSLEYLANLFYIFILWKMPRKWLPLLLGFAALAIAYVAHKNNTLSGGWHLNSYTDGLARIGFSFLVGLSLKRYNLIIKNKVGYFTLSILLLACLMLPNLNRNWAIELVIVGLFFPFLILMGAGATYPTKLHRIATFMGKISYPLYTTHYWFISSLSNYSKTHHPSNFYSCITVLVATTGLVLFAYLIMIIYDAPTRKWLTKKAGLV